MGAGKRFHPSIEELTIYLNSVIFALKMGLLLQSALNLEPNVRVYSKNLKFIAFIK